MAAPAAPDQEGRRMAKDALVTESLAAKFASEKDSPYTRWVAAEGLDIIAAHYVPDLPTVELKPWERRGGRGVFINHEATRTSNDCYVCEIPAGGSLAAQRQLFEEMVLVLDGQGSTRVWNDAGAEVSFEWQPESTRVQWRLGSPGSGCCRDAM
jgi:hypothetical protein